MAKVIAPITAKVEVIGKPRESSYEAGKFYYPTLFIDLSQPQGAEAAKIWKNLSGDEVSQFQKGDRVQLVPAGKDKSGKDKHNIMLLEEPARVAASERSPFWNSTCSRTMVGGTQTRDRLLFRVTASTASLLR